MKDACENQKVLKLMSVTCDRSRLALNSHKSGQVGSLGQGSSSKYNRLQQNAVPRIRLVVDYYRQLGFNNGQTSHIWNVIQI